MPQGPLLRYKMSTSTNRFSFRRVLLTSTISLAALLLAIWLGGRWYLQGSVMTMAGEQALASLDAPVEILFDERGIARVYSETDADALQALGWLHAGERLFQMELMRKVARGEISEIVGAAGLDSDRLHRKFGFAQRIQQQPPALSPTTERLVQAYVRGINQYIEQQPLPPSFRLTGQQPERWQISDVLTLAYYQSWYPLTLVDRMSEAWRSVADLHGNAGSDWLHSLPGWGLPTVPTLRMTEASNTWVVSPERSASNHALHASDPHLDYTMAPGLWYAVGLHSDEGLDVVGVTAPGLPFIAMGHNGQIAFGFTVAPVDLFEWYRMPLAHDNPNALIGPDGQEPILTRNEIFRVRGLERPIKETLQSSARGLVMARSEDNVTLMHWAGFDLPVSDLIEQAFALNKAQNFAQFRAAASTMGALSVNWSYSDRQGNIGYVQSTPIPKRTHQQFHQILDGQQPQYFWAGYLAPEERPYALNPEQGWLANANNHAASATEGLPEHLGWPMPGFYKHLRMRRAVDWLGSDTTFDADMMRRMQLDQQSERAMKWKQLLADSAARTGRSTLAEELTRWDGVMAVESDLAGLFARWWQFLPQQLFVDGPLPDWQTGRTLLDDWINRPPETFQLAAQGLARASDLALDEALKHGVRPLGTVQDLTIAHPLANIGILNAWLDLSRGPIPIGGGPGSLNVTYHRWNQNQARLAAAGGASMRFVMDWQNPNGFTLNLTLGQSGHPLSPHFDDFLSDFLTGTPWVVPMDRTLVSQQAASRMMLIPPD